MSNKLIEKLLHKRIYPHAVDELQLIETHISWVIIAGDYVYKLKKPVNYGFLDFSTLAKRKHFCEEELRLNQRFASSLYLCVLGIKETHASAEVGCDEEEADEFAVKMRRFNPATQFDRLLEKGQLKTSHMTALAETVHAFHQIAQEASSEVRFGSSDSIAHPVMENFTVIESLASEAWETQALQALKQWAIERHQALVPVFNLRKQKHFIRECHGDLHLQNIALWEGEPLMFDCIEFNDEFRWIDTINEIAFLVMDLHFRKQYSFAQIFLNHYLEHSGDYQGMKLISYYLSYRAMVRAKVARLRYAQALPEDEKGLVWQDYKDHIALAQSYCQPRQPIMILMYGLSGSGKTFIARELVKHIPAIMIRSDVERKRLFQTDPEALYSSETSTKTYQYLLQQAENITQGNYHAIIDASFQKRAYRQLFYDYARENNLPVFVIHCVTKRSVLEQRLTQRQKARQDISDADVSVLEMQINNWRDPESDEQEFIVKLNTEQDIDVNKVVNMLGLREFF